MLNLPGSCFLAQHLTPLGSFFKSAIWFSTQPRIRVSKGGSWGFSCAAGLGAADGEPCSWAVCSGCSLLSWAHALFQVVLINAIKDVAKALSDLIGATKGAASKPADDPSMYQLKGAAKVEWSPN